MNRILLFNNPAKPVPTMSYAIYKSLHLTALFLLFFSIGGLWLFYSAGKTEPRLRKALLILHGTAWLTAFVAGFGLIVRLNTAVPWPGWLYAKLLIGIFLGLIPLFFRKMLKEPKRLNRILTVLLVVFLIFTAVTAVHTKF